MSSRLIQFGRTGDRPTDEAPLLWAEYGRLSESISAKVTVAYDLVDTAQMLEKALVDQTRPLEPLLDEVKRVGDDVDPLGRDVAGIDEELERFESDVDELDRRTPSALMFAVRKARCGWVFRELSPAGS